MPTTYQELRQNLLEKSQRLKGQLDDLANKVREEGVGYSNHMADAGTEVFEQERDVSLARQLHLAYDDVQHALSKFDDGTFGICESCGTIIDLARLEALPAARHCLRCQSRREAKQ